MRWWRAWWRRSCSRRPWNAHHPGGDRPAGCECLVVAQVLLVVPLPGLRRPDHRACGWSCTQTSSPDCRTAPPRPDHPGRRLPAGPRRPPGPSPTLGQPGPDHQARGHGRSRGLHRRHRTHAGLARTRPCRRSPGRSAKRRESPLRQPHRYKEGREPGQVVAAVPARKPRTSPTASGHAPACRHRRPGMSIRCGRVPFTDQPSLAPERRISHGDCDQRSSRSATSLQSASEPSADSGRVRSPQSREAGGGQIVPLCALLGRSGIESRCQTSQLPRRSAPVTDHTPDAPRSGVS